MRFLVLLCACVLHAHAGTAFIDTLMARGFYRAADVECRRVLLSSGADSAGVMLRQGDIARALSRPVAARGIYERVVENGTAGRRITAGFRLTAMALADEAPALAKYELDEMAADVHGTNLDRWRLYRAVMHFLNLDDDSARTVLRAVEETSPLRPAAERMRARHEAFAGRNEKKEIYAYALSTLLPGSGQVYAGRPVEGVKSFLLNAAFGSLLAWAGWNAYDARQRDDGPAFRTAVTDATVIGTGFFLRYYNAGRSKIFKDVLDENVRAWARYCRDLLAAAESPVPATR